MTTDETLYRELQAHRRTTGVMVQQDITGEDWLSERDRKHQAKSKAAVRRASLAAAKKMQAAADALREQLMACLEAGYDDKLGAADGRRRLVSDLLELAAWFEDVYAKDTA